MYRMKTLEWADTQCHLKDHHCMTINCASWFGDTSYGFCYELYGEKGVSNMPEKHCESEFSKDVLAEYAQSSFGLQDIARPMSCDGLRETFEYVKEGLKGTDNVKEEPMSLKELKDLMKSVCDTPIFARSWSGSDVEGLNDSNES